MIRKLAALSVFTVTLFAQPRVTPGNIHKRVFAIVPYVGAGTWEDPKRPMFAPLPSELGHDKSGILAYYHESSDDGRLALVVFVATDAGKLQGLLSNRDSSVTVFNPGQRSQLQVETAFRLLKRDFDLKRFLVRVP